jgi:hypothetical protein
MVVIVLCGGAVSVFVYAATRRLRRWMRIALAVLSFLLLVVLPLGILMRYPDDPPPGARTISLEELSR